MRKFVRFDVVQLVLLNILKISSAELGYDHCETGDVWQKCLIRFVDFERSRVLCAHLGVVANETVANKSIALLQALRTHMLASAL